MKVRFLLAWGLVYLLKNRAKDSLPHAGNIGTMIFHVLGALKETVVTGLARVFNSSLGN